MPSTSPIFAELHCLTNFTFLRGASHASELVARAAQLGYAALAVTDECSLAGIVRAHEAAKEHGLPLVVGTEVRLADGPKLVLLATNREGYGNLAQLITTGRRAAAKGEYRLTRADLADGVPGCLVLWVPEAGDGGGGVARPLGGGHAPVGAAQGRVGGGHAPESGGFSESASSAPRTTDDPGNAPPGTIAFAGMARSYKGAPTPVESAPLVATVGDMFPRPSPREAGRGNEAGGVPSAVGASHGPVGGGHAPVGAAHGRESGGCSESASIVRLTTSAPGNTPPGTDAFAGMARSYKGAPTPVESAPLVATVGDMFPRPSPREAGRGNEAGGVPSAVGASHGPVGGGHAPVGAAHGRESGGCSESASSAPRTTDDPGNTPPGTDAFAGMARSYKGAPTPVESAPLNATACDLFALLSPRPSSTSLQSRSDSAGAEQCAGTVRVRPYPPRAIVARMREAHDPVGTGNALVGAAHGRESGGCPGSASSTPLTTDGPGNAPPETDAFAAMARSDRSMDRSCEGAPPPKGAISDGPWVAATFPGRAWIAAELHLAADDAERIAAITALSHALQLPVVASNDVHMHVRGRRALQDVLTATRLRTTVADAGFARFPNGERHLRRIERLAELYPAAWLAESVAIAARCTFSLDELRYEYPEEIAPAGETPTSWLRAMTEAGLAWRFGKGPAPWVVAEARRRQASETSTTCETSDGVVGRATARRGAESPDDVATSTGSDDSFPQTKDTDSGTGASRRAAARHGAESPDHVPTTTPPDPTPAPARTADPAPAHVRALIEHELTLITELGYEPYFLTVFDIVCFARRAEILCQGRGSAANSAVCYALGITEVDPARMSVLFERFISRERNEPPDIDVDFEHERREEVIQYIYAKYGRARAALTATVISYRPKSAFRDVGKALGFDIEQVDRIARNLAFWDKGPAVEERLREVGFDPASPRMRQLLVLVRTILGFPRHLSQHVGGFVVSRGPLSRLVPIENAAMPDRSIIQWDKDDLDTLGLLKVDILALGMLSALRRGLAMVSARLGRPFGLHDIPAEDTATYDMLCAADSVGVFQVESRAQMSMLPRLQPRRFYDLVIEVAIVRPGPIQGGMVHPYLRRRRGQEPVTYPSEDVKAVLERTLGVPIFQEQVMQIAMVAAGFSAGEADRLRRSMAAWRRKGGIEQYAGPIIEGMVARGYERPFAEAIFQQILGFGEYGFPESHAASFALLVYASAWLKKHEPAAFCAALLNSQPMGFYAPSQLVQDAQRHGVQVLPVDVLASGWESTVAGAAHVGAGHALAGGDHAPENGRFQGTPQPEPSLSRPWAAPTTARSVPGVGGASALVGGGHAPESGDRQGTPQPEPSLSRPWAAPTTAGSVPGVGGVSALVGGGHAPESGRCQETPSTTTAAATTHSPADTIGTLRLGLQMVQGLSREGAERLIAARAQPWETFEQLARRAKLDRRDLGCLARAGALASVAGHRHAARWMVAGIEDRPPLIADVPMAEAEPDLPIPREGEDISADYASLGLSLGRHPMALLRPRLARLRMRSATDLLSARHGQAVRAAGLVTCRQRPGTASGVVFVTLEDETGTVNVVVWRDVSQRQRRVLLGARLLAVHGVLERDGEVAHLIAGRLEDLSTMLGELVTQSRDFH
jgi:error-prone DNA polymerase